MFINVAFFGIDKNKNIRKMKIIAVHFRERASGARRYQRHDEMNHSD